MNGFQEMIKVLENGGQKSNGIRIWRDKGNTEEGGVTKGTKSLKTQASGLVSK